MTETIQKIIEVIRNNSTFLLTTHEGPDGDAIGSSLALASFLCKIGKDVIVHYRDPVPELYLFLPAADLVLPNIPDRHFDVAFVLDIGELKRAGREFCDFSRCTTTVNLDHHLSCDNFGDYNLIDNQAAATGILVYRIANAFGYNFDRETALCIYVAIITDTGSFRYSNANREAFVVAG
ncbi:MAG: DHH family phosphoesterase, partial [Deltaproteobacteria bacterium]|nr:DHH family phosphoesterase [Deltaproteobacteria bacterium]